MSLRIVPGSASGALAGLVAAALSTESTECEIDRFPDGEIRPRVASLRGSDTYVVQSVGPPVADNLVELLLLVDACRRAGAQRVTVVVPYLGYARQDQRSRPGEALGGRVVADTIVAAGADRMVVVDPHSPAVEAMFGLPVEVVSAVAVLAPAVAEAGVDNGVVIAPDLGAAKLARRYADHLGLPVAVVHKSRLTGEAVRADDVTGDVAGRTPLVVDDMISTGGTIQAAVGAVLARGAVREVVVAATHGLLVGPAADRLASLPIRRLLVTDTIATRPTDGVPVEVRSVGAELAEAVQRLHGTTPAAT